MSKKTNAEKRKALTRPRRRAHKLKGRKNPPVLPSGEKVPSPFGDPIFMHHVASLIFRYLELLHPAELDIINAVEPGDFDAEFAPEMGKAFKTTEPKQ